MVFIIDKSERSRKKKPVQIDPKSVQSYPDGRMDGLQLARNLATQSLQQTAATSGTAIAQIVSVKQTEPSFLDDVAGFFGVETKSVKQIKIQARYKCRLLSVPDGYPVPQPQSAKDNINDIVPMYFVLPSNSDVDLSLLTPGVTVMVRLDNRNTSFISDVAGTIESVANPSATIEQFSSNCKFELPKSSGEAKTTLLKECGVAIGGSSGRKIKTASATPPRPTGRGVVSPTSPLTGGKVTSEKDIGEINSGYPVRNDNTTPHKGLDLKSEMGSPVASSLDGIAYLGQDSRDPDRQGYGYYVVVKHTKYETTTENNTFYTLYAHLEKDNRRSGKVSAGQEIGKSSDTGSPGSPHLHFEVIYEHNPGWKTANQMTQGGATDPVNNFFLNKFKKL